MKLPTLTTNDFDFNDFWPNLFWLGQRISCTLAMSFLAKHQGEKKQLAWQIHTWHWNESAIRLRRRQNMHPPIPGVVLHILGVCIRIRFTAMPKSTLLLNLEKGKVVESTTLQNMGC